MELLFAPMEGVTYPAFRRIHAAMFPGAAAYYTPFIAPDTTGSFKPKYLAGLLPDARAGVKVVPQLLGNRPEALAVTARKLCDLGFEEIDLNLGCPSGTVVSKHKGAGLLGDLPALECLLDELFSQTDLKIGVKTRMGVTDTAEFPEILRIYDRFPLSHLIIHARSRAGMYKSEPDLTGFARAFLTSRCRPIYNGGIASQKDLDNVAALCPGLTGVMVGRGAVADPALLRELSGGLPLQPGELSAFHDALLEAYLTELTPAFAVERMKHLWTFRADLGTPEQQRLVRRVLKTRQLSDYRSAASLALAAGPPA